MGSGRSAFKFVIAGLVLFLLSDIADAAHLHLEKEYQAVWCNQQQGMQEYVLDDLSRVDCLTAEYAVEFDFAYKWAESIGQSLYYGLKTGKAPGIVLIIEEEKDKKHLPKIKLLTERYGIRLWEMGIDGLK